jgi:hypothetical protein
MGVSMLVLIIFLPGGLVSIVRQKKRASQSTTSEVHQ